MEPQKYFFFDAHGRVVFLLPQEAIGYIESEAIDYARRHNLQVIARKGHVVCDYREGELQRESERSDGG